MTDKNFKVFGINGWHIFDHSYTKESPKGTLEARFKETDTSWPGWKRDLGNCFSIRGQIGAERGLVCVSGPCGKNQQAK
jgi:hypothetical protein